MKILYFYQYFTVPQGSYSTRVYEFARRWVKAGDSVTVITSVYDKSGIKPQGLISRIDVEGIDVRMINIRLSQTHGFVARLASFAAYALVSCWYALTLPADVVVCSSGPLSVGVPGLLARFVRRLPFVFEVRDLWPEGAIQLEVIRNAFFIRMARWFEGLCYRAATRIVALSPGMADWIRGEHGLDHIDVVPNASDNELVESLNGEHADLPAWATGKHLVLYTGSMGLMDDCGQILDAACVLKERAIQDIEFVLIGDGKQRADLENKARLQDLSHVHFLGLLPKPETMQWLKQASSALMVMKDVPVLATVSPNKLFDAFASGRPVVQTTQGWIKDLTQKEQCGVTVPADDPRAMADAVLQLTRDGERRNVLAANAARVAKQFFDRSLLASKFRNVLLDIVSNRAKRSS